MKSITISLLFALILPSVASARIVAFWPYEKLFDQADFVAVTELHSIKDSKAQLTGYGNEKNFAAKTVFSSSARFMQR